jgi:hypothetical protein
MVVVDLIFQIPASGACADVQDNIDTLVTSIVTTDWCRKYFFITRNKSGNLYDWWNKCARDIRILG